MWLHDGSKLTGFRQGITNACKTTLPVTHLYFACDLQAAADAAEPSGAPEQAEADEDEWDLQQDLEARKAGLRRQLAAFTKVGFQDTLQMQAEAALRSYVHLVEECLEQQGFGY